MAKQTGEIFVPKKLKDRFCGINALKNFLGINETPPILERSFDVTTKLRLELPTDAEMENIPLMGLSSLAEDIHVKTREASRNTDLDIREFLEIDKVLQTIQGELVNKTSKLREINERIKNECKKLKEVQDDPSYFVSRALQ